MRGISILSTRLRISFTPNPCLCFVVILCSILLQIPSIEARASRGKISCNDYCDTICAEEGAGMRCTADFQGGVQICPCSGSIQSTSSGQSRGESFDIKCSRFSPFADISTSCSRECRKRGQKAFFCDVTVTMGSSQQQSNSANIYDQCTCATNMEMNNGNDDDDKGSSGSSGSGPQSKTFPRILSQLVEGLQQARESFSN